VSLSLPPLLGYQSNTVDRINEIRNSGVGRSILAVAPPGAGKSRTMMELADQEFQKGNRSLIKVHRRMLLEQMIKGFVEAGYEIGVIAPDYKEGEPIPGLDTEVINDLDAPILIGSTQTLFARTVRRSRFEFPKVSLVVNDEAHQQTGKQERALAYGAFTENGFIQEGYLAKGATLVGFTATPLMNQRIYTDLIQMVNYSELRKQGMHLPIQLFGPDEIDTSGLKVNSEGEFKEQDLEPRVQAIFGSVHDEYLRLNPNKLPSILFAPSVQCSKWFCYQLSARGIPCGHIDGESILMSDGNRVTPYASTKENRKLLLEKSKSGEIKILCNRFVLREAIDMPWLYHAIFATVMGSTTTALQSVGRLQRFFPGYAVKILQDHGGFAWRHGSPNSDRYWQLGNTNSSYAKERIEKIIKGEIPEGMRCPKCSMWRTGGPVCPNESCRHASSQSVRAVRQVNGKLKHIKGSVFTAENMVERAKKLWKYWLWRGGKAGMTVGGIVAACGDDARKKGIKVDFNSVPWKPPASDSMEWHRLARDHWPWLKSNKKKVEQNEKATEQTTQQPAESLFQDG